MILSLIIISHLWDIHISIIPDIKYYIMKLLYLLSIIFQITTSKTQKFSYFKNKKNIIILHAATLQGWIEIASLNYDRKIEKFCNRSPSRLWNEGDKNQRKTFWTSLLFGSTSWLITLVYYRNKACIVFSD